MQLQRRRTGVARWLAGDEAFAIAPVPSGQMKKI
ncbi:hypothetical protein OKW20_001644 [Ensifer sp. LBL]